MACFEPFLTNAVPQHFAGAENPTCCKRPTADLHRVIERCGAASLNRPFIPRAAFWTLNCRSADFSAIRCSCIKLRIIVLSRVYPRALRSFATPQTNGRKANKGRLHFDQEINSQPCVWAKREGPRVNQHRRLATLPRSRTPLVRWPAALRPCHSCASVRPNGCK